jgi:hypothetical protein
MTHPTNPETNITKPRKTNRGEGATTSGAHTSVKIERPMVSRDSAAKRAAHRTAAHQRSYRASGGGRAAD